MTANWKIVRATLAWLLVALVTLGIVVASPYATRSSAASASYPKVTSCKGLTVKKTGKVWATFRDKDGKRVSYTGIAKNSNGWWRTVNGVVDFSYTGIAKNDNGWYRVVKGKVDFNAQSIYKNENGWYKTTDGKVTFKENSIYKNQNGWYKCTNSKVTFKENGVFKNEKGWWYVKNSKVDFTFTGLASNENGLWYIEDGNVRFDANGTYEYEGKYYSIKNGRATEIGRNDAAVAAAKELTEDDPLSLAMLTEIMTEEYGFTKAEVDYAVDKLDLNFYTHALLASGIVLGDWDAGELNGVSEDLYLQIMKDTLEFTEDEIEYAHSIVKKDANKDGGYWKNQCRAAAQELKESGDEFTKATLTEYLTNLLFTKNQVTNIVNEFFPG